MVEMRGFEPLTSCMRSGRRRNQERLINKELPDFFSEIGVDIIERLGLFGGLKIINGHFLDTNWPRWKR
jgi:hypothetical protein